MPYFLPDRYIPRLDPVNDFEGEAQRKDDCQKEVYDEAAKLAREFELNRILDLGTGSGWKLMKHFGGQSSLEVIGIDLLPAVEILKRRYPDRAWATPERLEEVSALYRPDLIICSDMIEHVLDPDATLETIKSLRPKWIMMSTPDRDLVDRYFHPTNKTFGPPRNRCHVREWTFPEFRQYMNSHFDVVRHFLSNAKQCTQCAVMRLK